MKRLLVFLLCFAAVVMIAGIYGALHDQVSYTISSEYFTELKFRQFRLTESALPDRMRAAIVGFLATWWMGIPVGILVGGFGFLHQSPKMMLLRTMKSYAHVVLVVMLAGIAGIAVGWLSTRDFVPEYLGRIHLSEMEHPRNFLIVGYMHSASYLGGALGLVAGVLSQFRQR